jgi:hypothetical protein
MSYETPSDVCDVSGGAGCDVEPAEAAFPSRSLLSSMSFPRGLERLDAPLRIGHARRALRFSGLETRGIRWTRRFLGPFAGTRQEDCDMPAQLGKIYVTPGGAEMIVTKGSSGTLSDGSVPLLMKGSGESFPGGAAAGSGQIQLGKRYKSADGAVEVLVNKPGPCDLRYDGQPMELKEAKPLPSSD